MKGSNLEVKPNNMKKSVYGLGALALMFGTVAIYPVLASAYRGDVNVKGPNYSTERHEAMQKAFALKDYDAWASLMHGRGRVTEVVNRENFSKFAEAHELMLQGKTSEANQKRENLGLGSPNRSGRGLNRANR
jgi:hypothetical protein